MASEFIGYNVLVTLQVPPGGKLQGQVANVIGQTLLLKNGMILDILPNPLESCSNSP
jgi:enhancer of mRNA-decapping protein 3